MARRSHRRSRERKKWFAVAAVAAMILVVALGIAGLLLKANRDNPDLAASTNCPEGGPVSITAIVVDRTDPLTPVTRADVRSQLLNYARSVPRFGQLVIFGAGADENELLTPGFARCNPGSAADVSVVTSQPQRVQERYDRDYFRPLEREVDHLLQIESARQSPILEGIQAVTIAAFPPGTETRPRRLVVVSDLLQNSRRLSMYRGDLTSPAIANFSANLTGVRVDLLVVEREREHPFQNAPGFLAFWTTWFSDGGAHVRRVLHLAGRN